MFTEWYVCFPDSFNKLKCIKTTPIAKGDYINRRNSILIPVCGVQPQIFKEFVLKYKYYSNTKAVIIEELD